MASRLANPLTIPVEDEFDLFDVMSALTDPVRRRYRVELAEEPGRACSNADYGVSKSPHVPLAHSVRVRPDEAGGARKQAPKLVTPRRR